jgi:L-alanine-DL-glutamate epimerase-like enolase superfamily enzyme
MKVDRLDVEVYRFPTRSPEADGTLEWDATTAVVVIALAGNLRGLGWTYSTPAAARVVRDVLSPAVAGLSIDDVPSAFEQMRRACRNFGTRGLVMQAISGVDIALWDLKARAHELSLTQLLGCVRDDVPVYGSGGFVSMSDTELADQLEHWERLGCSSVKIKIGQDRGGDVARDLERVRAARAALPSSIDLMVDANGAYSVGQARRVGDILDEVGVTWFEEPVTSDDVHGLARLSDALRCDVAAGEYVAELTDAAALVDAVDCLQLDVTRCGGYTGFRRCAALAEAHQLQVSAHCAPALHAPVAATVPNLRHVEYFADHERLEPLLVHVAPCVSGGRLRPNATIGHGYSLRADLRRWQSGDDR